MTSRDASGGEEVERLTLDQVVQAEQVTLEEVFQQAPVPSVREVGPLTRIGYRLAIFLLLYLSVVTLVLLVDFFVNAPSLPTGSPLGADQLNQYQQLSQISEERTLKLLDALVIKGFLPVLTLILGYIFGTRGADGGTT